MIETGRLRGFKGHGTENDFVLVPDLDAELELSDRLVRALCDRRAGLGGDGVLRVVRTAEVDEPVVRGQAESAEFFMDYRNADGSVAEMCGNGVRVFARYLHRAGLIGDQAVIATRGGRRAVQVHPDHVTVDMGRPRRRPERPDVAGHLDNPAFDLPNPHVVIELAGSGELDGLDLSTPPEVSPALPAGQNVEFFLRTGPRQVRMRVHERGVGETRSCGTGICAVAVAAVGPGAWSGDSWEAAAVWPVGETWEVVVPGGTCTVGRTESGTLTLTGPAELVAEFELDEGWLAAHR